MKLQNLTVIFIIIILPVILLVSLYISNGLKTIKYQSLYDNGLLSATHDAIYAFEQNTANNDFSNNPEIKRDIIKASVKMFEKSLCNACNISSYNTDEIEEYIPAIIFGMYDGFYMYAPSELYNGVTGKYEYKHNLKNYVYYSETINIGTETNPKNIVIRYSLDNYVVVSGMFKNDANHDEYQSKSGYLINGSTEDGTQYKGIDIDTSNIDAINYYKEAYDFTNWFNSNVGNEVNYLKIDNNNDPEDSNSLFSQHKKIVIKNKIEGVLNSSITAYSNKTWGNVYKMPKLLEEDWEKIYQNISMITFFQGKNIGFTKYNGYCVLNSTNNNEYVNSNLMYFIDGNGYYHDIRCEECLRDGITLIGYKIGDFQKKKVEQVNEITGEIKIDENGNVLYEYKYNHNELACYKCINGQLTTPYSVSEYLENADEKIKTSYYTSLAKERYNTSK